MLFSRSAGQSSRRNIHLVSQRLHAVIGHGDPIGAEGVGLEDIGTRLHVLLVDALDHRWPGQHQQVVVSLQVARPVGKTLASVVGLVELVALNHSAHGAVQNEDASA